MVTTLKSSRIEVVDALRGFAVMSIMLLHNIEHFDFYYFPEYLPQWVKVMDVHVWDALFFLFSGKSYAIFALLFGFSFFIQLNNQEKRGGDFRMRFLWRLLLLLVFGVINSTFYEGDILTFYAVIGLVLVPVCKWSNKAVLITAILCMLQPWEWGNFFYAQFHPTLAAHPNLSDQYFGKSFPYLSGHSFIELAKGNLTNGRWAVVFWSWENGRFFQSAALFMLGMLLGRKALFVTSETSSFFWKRLIVISIISAIVLFYVKENISSIFLREALYQPLHLIFTTWYNLFFMLIWVSGFVLLYKKQIFYPILSKLVPFGKMSLSNYVIQSILGSLIYYGYGLALYQYTGATFSLLIAITLFILQLTFCHWWFTKFRQGPLEFIWHKATWIGDKYKNA